MRDRTSLLFLSLMIFGSALFVLAYGGIEWMASSLRICLMGLSAFMLLWLPVGLELIEGKHDLFAPIPLQAAGYSLLFVISGTYLMLKPAVNIWRYTEHFDDAMAVMLLGWFATVVGNRVTVGRRLAPSLPRIRWPDIGPADWLPIVLLLLTIGWIGQLIQVVAGVYFHSFGSSFRWSPGNSVVQQIRLVRYVGLVLLALQAWQPGEHARPFRRLLLIVALLEAAFSLGSGKRIDVVSLMFILMACYSYSRQLRISPRLIAKLLLGALLGLVLIGLLAEYRNHLLLLSSIRPAGRVSLSDMWRAAQKSLRGTLSYERFQQIMDSTMVRFGEIASLAALLSPAGTADRLRLGSTFLPSLLTALLTAVPRNILPIKPDVNSPYYPFMSYYFPYISASRPITYVGESYYNFGLVGVLVIMFFYGIFQDLFYHYCNPDRGDNTALRVTYILLALRFAWVSANLAPMIAYLARYLLYAWLTGLLINVQRNVGGRSRIVRQDLPSQETPRQAMGPSTQGKS